MQTDIAIPFNFSPRKYQQSLFEAAEHNIKRYVTVWHRRAGKDKTWLNFVIWQMMQRVGAYFYFFPTYAQGKKILWDGADKSGFRFLNHFPKDLIDGEPNSTEMKLRLTNGSLFQVVGADNINSVVGTNPVGCVYSEFALQNPVGWDYISPILRENDGWAGFNFTPRGKNHAHSLYQMAKTNPDWFCSLLTVDDTGVFSKEDIEKERREGKTEEFLQQEYYCSFDAPMQGSYYGDQLRRAEKEGRITVLQYDPVIPVDTWWDIGIGDATAIWFTQTDANSIRFIDYYEERGQGLPFYKGVLNEKNYLYSTHHAPHDIENKEFGSGRSRIEIARSLGINFKVVPKLKVEDGIEAARAIFQRCWFDVNKCKKGLEALGSYRKEWDDKRSEYKNKPYHDWSSHAADAYRYFATGHRDAISPKLKERYKPKYVGTEVSSWKTA